MAQVSNNNSEYIVKEALLSADRSFKTDQVIDIYGMIAEVSIFESLEKPYLTAKVVVVDTQKVITDEVNLQGNEKLKLTITTDNHGKLAENNDFTINLRVVSIEDDAKTNDYTSVFVLSCISEHAFHDSNVQISRSYKGQVEDISEKVLDDYLDVKVERDDTYWKGETIQGRLKLIVPYLSPLDTVSWLTERGCMKDASPIFMWQTIWDEKDDTKVRLGNLGQMIMQGSLKVYSDASTTAARDYKRTFTFFQRGPGLGTNSALDRESTSRENRSVLIGFGSTSTNSSDTLKMMQEGALGSRFSTLDTYTTQKFDRHFDIEEYLDFYRKENVTKSKEVFPDAFDEDVKVTVGGEEKSPSKMDSRHRNAITSYGTYEWENSYHDVADPTAAMNKIRKGVVKNLMYRELIDVTLPGYSFMIEELGTGDCIGLRIPENYTDDAAKKQTMKSEMHSGVYMILALRHIFISNTHKVVATCCKIEDVESK